MSEKRHPPSARRLREARKQGQVPRSRLFSSAAVTFAALAATLHQAPAAAEALRAYAAWVLGPGAPAPGPALEAALALGVRLLGPILGAALAAALAAGLLAAGLHLEPGLVAPRLDRLDPAAGLRRLLGLQQLQELGKGLLVAAVVGALVVRGARSLGPDALRAAWAEGARAPSALLLELGSTLLQAAGALLILGLGDLALARRRHLRSLRMSHEELAREQRSAEGDPHARGQRRARHRALASGGPARGVAAATVVVVNPTHLAVGLRFLEAECDAPYIVARGHGEDAMELKREAAARGVPVVKDIPLARALVQYEPGEEVPEELYQAAAAVLKVALELGGRGPGGGEGGGGAEGGR